MRRQGKNNSITDVPGVEVGNYTDPGILSGLTVVLAEEGTVGGVDVRGGSPGTRETDLLSPLNRIERVDAVALCGNSAYGLNAVGGAMRFLEERGRGHLVGEGRVVPMVPAAVLYDLGRGERYGHLSEENGYKACEEASKGPVPMGNIGAGTGAVSGSLKGGLGTASEVLENGFTVGAVVAVNSSGSAVNQETGGFYARHLELGGEFCGLRSDIPLGPPSYRGFEGNAGHHTTIGAVATDALLTKAQAAKVAQMAQDGIARAIYPAHTMFDGDAVFVLATGERELPREGSRPGRGEAEALSLIGASAADAFARAIIHALLEAETVGRYTCYRDKYLEAFRDDTSE